jgi:putative alpha-1,2-mannosidase
LRKIFVKARRSALLVLLITSIAIPIGLPVSLAQETRRAGEGGEALVDLVNPLMGTDSNFELSYGNTYPATAVPWGMNFWTPVTGEMGSG